MKLLVALDFSDASPLILAAVRQLVGADAHVHLLHAVAPEPDFIGYGVGPQYVRDDVAQEIMNEHHEIHALAAALSQSGIPTEGLLIQAPAAAAILAEAEKRAVDLIVVGSHGHGALYHLLTGSVVKEVLHDSTRPVLVVPVRHLAKG